jgi:hypothetical protein
MTMTLPTSFNRWVNDNNPSAHLEYGKGWWDYVEILQRLIDKFGIEEPEVVGTYLMKTPPPQEELLMPVVKLKMKDAELIVKYDFGTFPERWTISANTSKALVGSTLGLFNKNTDLRLMTVNGFQPEWLYPPYRESQTRFSCELRDEWDLATFIRFISNDDAQYPALQR